MRLLFILFLFIYTNTTAHIFEHPSTWGDPRALNILKNAKVIDSELMRDFLKRKNKDINFNNNKVFMLTLEGDIKAVFKAFDENDQNEAHAEVAAFQASLYMGFPKIPPTVVREVRNMKGSLQLFVETSIDLGKEEQFKTFMKDVSRDDLANLNLFYFIFGQWDTDEHNVMAYKDTQKNYIIAIDNGDIADTQHVKYGERPYVKILESKKLETKDAGKPFPFASAKLEHIDKIQKTYGDKLPPYLYKRYKGKSVNYIIYQNAFWRQYYTFDRDALIQPFSAYAPADTLKKLKTLDQSAIVKIFDVGEKVDFLTDDYIDSILNRRDQVLAHFAMNI